MKSIRKKVENVTQVEHLNSLKKGLSKAEYLVLEENRKDSDWARIINKQDFKCYYCNTDIRTIQKLILNHLIGLRKRGPSGYSGLHFELDHKNANNKDNNRQNLVAACYYCNNDKSNTISEKVFLNYFGPLRKIAFHNLLKYNNLVSDDLFVHHSSLNTTK
jgi:5-methylcytosine-specific restriction endonuclease McrA